MRLGRSGSGTLLLIDGCGLRGEQDPLAEQVEAGPARHGAFDQLAAGEVPVAPTTRPAWAALLARRRGGHRRRHHRPGRREPLLVDRGHPC